MVTSVSPHKIEIGTDFQVEPRVDGVYGETPKPVKGYPLRVPMNNLATIASLPITLPV